MEVVTKKQPLRAAFDTLGSAANNKCLNFICPVKL